MNKIISGTVAILIVIVLITSMVIPIVESGQGSMTKTVYTNLENEGTPLIKGDVSQDYSIAWDSALPGMVKVNGNVVTVNFVAGADATVSPSSKDVITDLTYGELPTPTRTGYTFDGWFTSTAYTTEVTEDTVVTGTSDVILYAKWIGNEYTVTFDAGSGTVSPATKTVTFGQAYGELPVPEYTGHNFGGWFDSDDNPITSSTIVSIAEDHTLDAEYTVNQYLVSFTTDGNGTVDVQSVTVDYGTSYTISDNTITIGATTITATPSSGYSWGYWTPGTSGTVEGAMTFTANFYLPPVTIYFTANSPGTVDTASIVDVPRGTQYVVADNVVTITGYSPVTASLPNGYYMTGWNIAQGTGTITDTMTFTADYEVIEIAKVSASDLTTWVLTTDGKLFGCGQNNYGQQGDGTTTNVTTFTQRLSNEIIADIDCSVSTTWAVTTDGKLFGCGTGGYGHQGDGTTNNVTTFTQRLSNETIASVSCSNSTTWALTTDGKLFGCGSNNSGQQGDGTTTNVNTFTQRLDTETISKVVCSAYTTWAVTTDGKLFGCGSNGSGQQGDGTTTAVNTFTQRLSNETIADVECVANSTWAITTDGKLFGCGNNAKGQQGDGTTTNVNTFTQRLDTETISKVVCSTNTTWDVCVVWAITTDGKLFGCGSATFGQQGISSATNITTFTQRLDTETISKVVCSAKTTWAITTDGKLFGCGNNENGQQGSGGTLVVRTFTQRLGNEIIADMGCSESTTWAITTDGKLFGCGRNDNSQQGDGTTTDVMTFTQRGPPGTVNITPVQVIPNLQPIHNPGLSPFTPIPLSPLSLTPLDIVGTDYTFHAGGNDWMLCTVSTGVDQYALALFYAGLSDPLMWDDDVTLLFSNGSLTVENDGQTYTMTYTSIFYKGNGDYLLMSGDSAYVDSDTELIGFAIPEAGNGIEVSGTVSSVTAANIGGDVVVGAGSVTSASTDYDGVYTISEVSAGYGTDQTAICTSVIIPNKVVITTTTEYQVIDDILAVIPVFLLLTVFLMIGSVLIIKKMQ